MDTLIIYILSLSELHKFKQYISFINVISSSSFDGTGDHADDCEPKIQTYDFDADADYLNENVKDLITTLL